MKCPQCDADIGDDSVFCKECGTNITSAGEVQPAFTKTLETPVAELTRGAFFAGRYEVIEELGKGGMGAVYRVEDTEAREEIALKLVRPEIAADKKTIERFRNELTTARKIRHKNICGMYDLAEHKGVYFITMEYVPGQDLKGLIRQSAPLSVSRTIKIAKQICEGLAEAHRQQVVHRDLKPQNIMIDPEGDIKIMDFGIARSLQGKGITGAGMMIGTPEYMSPEQVEAKGVDQRADIYSLGILLYEMITGKLPFAADTPFAVGLKHKSEAPKPPKEFNPQVSEDLNEVILRCLEKEKENRYQSMTDVQAELEKIEKGMPRPGREFSAKKPLTSKEITVSFNVKRLFLPVSIAAFLAIAAVLVIYRPWSQKVSAFAPKIENSLAVISFKNQTGDSAYDHLQEVIPNLLITNLENTGLFQVATWERMKDILKQMDVKQVEFIDSDLGFEICRRAGYQAIAIGTLSKAGDVFIMDVKVLDPETKRTLKSTNTRGTGADSIFSSQIDELSRDISLGLGAAFEKVEATQFNIKDITTHSLEAYQYLLKGKEALSMAAWTVARGNLEKALEIDPSFAMAYVYLAWTYFEPLQEESLVETIKQGLTLSDGISHKGRLYLTGLNAYFVEQDVGEAVRHLDELLQKYPDEKWALHVSGDFTRMSGDLEGAFTRYQKWLELDLQDANALWHFGYSCLVMGKREILERYTRMHEAVASSEIGNMSRLAQLYVMMGQVGRAISKREEIIEIHPDSSASMNWLIYLYALEENYDEALRWANDSLSNASSQEQKLGSYTYRGFIYNMRGAFNNALADYSMVIQIAEQLKNNVAKVEALEGKAFTYYLKREYRACRKSYENMFSLISESNIETTPQQRAGWAFDLGMLDLAQGKVDQASVRVSEIESLLLEMNSEQAPDHKLMIDLLQGEMLLAQEDFDKALVVGKRACGAESPYWKPGMKRHRFSTYHFDLVARIYAKKGEFSRAISEYERLFETNCSTGFCILINPLFHYRLGLMYEDANETYEAIAEFEKFLDLLKDADPSLTEVADARERVAELR
jgi:serine/threonine protein kinase/tetratricopeptide (TPR) repeat protein